MMEEVSDDTNGESSFEFVSGKIDENSSKDDSPSLVSTEQSIASSFAPTGETKNFTMPVNLAAPTFPVTSQKTDPGVTFYDVDPKSSQSVMLPSLLTPGASSQTSSSVQSVTQSHYSPAQQSYLPSSAPSTPYQAPHKQQPPPSPPTQQSYFTPPTQQQPYSSPTQQSYFAPPTQQQPYSSPPTQQPYFTPPTHHSTLNLPVEPADTAMPDQQPEGSVWGWLKGKDFLNKVAEKAKNSVDSVITTLDPGMKEIINTGGDINVIVASGNEDKISAVREAFQLVFGKATVQGMAVQSSSIAPQPVGFSAGLKAAEERINNLKQMGISQDRQILLSVENFLTELTPDNWFDIGCLVLQDQSSGITLQVYTEAIPISSQYVTLAKDQTPPDYPLGWSGYAVTIGQIMGSALGVHHSQWHQALTGVSRREILFVAAKTIAGLYRSQAGR